MPKAKNTSPKASVRRFNGGQFAIDSDEGINKPNIFGLKSEQYKATNLAHKGIGKTGTKFSARVGVHPGAPWGMTQQIDSDEGINVRNWSVERTHDYKDSDKSSGKAARVSPAKMPARVGGGHPRKHQG